MQHSPETDRLPVSPKTWLAWIVATGLAISAVAGWYSYIYGNGLDQLMASPAFPLLAGSVVVLAFLAMTLRGLVFLVFRWRKNDYQRPVPGLWSLAWLSFQLACMFALLALAVVELAALFFGHPEKLFQGFMVVLVSSGLLFLAGGAIRELSYLVRIFRQ